MPESAMSKLGNTYHDFIRQHPNAADEFADAIEDLLNDAGIIFDRVATRVKTWPSYKAKAKKKRTDGTLMYPNPWEDIKDLIGVRITVFNSNTIPKAIEVLGDSFTVVRSVNKTAETRVSGGFGYGSHHLILEPTDVIEELAPYKGRTFEVQIRTVLQHAWAEFEHDIRYKQGPSPTPAQVDRLFTLAAGLIELADQQFDEIAALKDPSTDADEDVEISPETLPGILAVILGGRFPRSRSEHYRWLAELLELSGISTMSQLKDLLNVGDITLVNEALRYRFEPSQVRLIDDLLLNRLGQDYIDATGDTGTRNDRPARLAGRLKQLESFKKRNPDHSGN